MTRWGKGAARSFQTPNLPNQFLRWPVSGSTETNFWLRPGSLKKEPLGRGPSQNKFLRGLGGAPTTNNCKHLQRGHALFQALYANELFFFFLLILLGAASPSG